MFPVTLGETVTADEHWPIAGKYIQNVPAVALLEELLTLALL